jgi:flagellar motor protein MotB
MYRGLFLLAVAGTLSITAAWGQDSPIYRVNVTERTVDAVNYQYRQGPTKIDFAGTVLLPHASGDATVESKEGRTEIEADFKGLAAPTRFGREYLTYVLWAITPEGRARNLGEVLANGSDHAKLRVTTDLQAFGLIVTAEPYSAIRQPSDVVVLENHVRPDTVGKIEPIKAKYDLLPRSQYTYTVPADTKAAEGNGPRVSLDQYQATLELYQALNAIQMAQSEGADRYASGTFQKAEDLYNHARDLQSHKGNSSQVVTAAREAAQTAEDARIIADRRKNEDELARSREQAAHEKAAADQARAHAQRLEAQMSATRAQLENQQDAQQRARMEQAAEAAVPPPARPAAAPAPPAPVTSQGSSEQKAVRLRLLDELNGAFEARDTPRGLVVTLPDADFSGNALIPSVSSNVARISSILAAQPGLRVDIEGNSDTNDEASCHARAEAVRNALVRGGLSPSEVVARSLGDSRPIVSNSSAAGRERNRRVEIVVSGNPIGDMPYWDQSYSIRPR